MRIIYYSFFCSIFLLSSCNEKKELDKYDKNGKLIVYSEEVYFNMLMKNKKLDVTIIDTFCINQKAKAIKDIKKGELIYFGSHSYEKILSKMLSQYGIKYKDHLGHCTRLGSFEPYCYQIEMWKEIDKRYGENFIDSLSQIAKKQFVLENPDVPYIEDGIDLREKYKKESK
ncbi:hypothetical protein [Flavobacterium mesophilum]|uniref:hypothetical protein n=1 Tax=Flavobacterium mesophilum TaxID=3143495 RepID=UPI0031D0CAF0